MKKIIVMLLAFVLLLGLCACGKETPASTEPEIKAEPKVEATVAAEEPAAPTEAPTEAPAETEAPAADKKALAEGCIDQNVSELYALIGEPESSDYAPSCLVDGEDGTLYYDGFVVYTTREGDVETVYYVE